MAVIPLLSIAMAVILYFVGTIAYLIAGWDIHSGQKGIYKKSEGTFKQDLYKERERY